MLKYLLDTDICIYAIKRHPESVVAAFETHEGRMAISAITHFELVYGAEKSQAVARNLGVVERFAARLEVLPFDGRGAEQAGQIRAELARAATPIGAYDVMIAGHARACGLILVTNNRREFDRVSGLRRESWT
ncbi:MAG: tRNA(fMet)-specific endonuclease VapC [Alphaproteobacteria bacterium]|nr:tRNA(fMet)-specific endonuclease VapC [Alphaproteobacteria bacterium]